MNNSSEANARSTFKKVAQEVSGGPGDHHGDEMLGSTGTFAVGQNDFITASIN
jgi:hypothetical protein